MCLCVEAGGCAKNKNWKPKPFSFKPSLFPPHDSGELGFTEQSIALFQQWNLTEPSPASMKCCKDAEYERKMRCTLAEHTHTLAKTVSGKSRPSEERRQSQRRHCSPGRVTQHLSFDGRSASAYLRKTSPHEGTGSVHNSHTQTLLWTHF